MTLSVISAPAATLAAELPRLAEGATPGWLAMGARVALPGKVSGRWAARAAEFLPKFEVFTAADRSASGRSATFVPPTLIAFSETQGAIR